MGDTVKLAFLSFVIYDDACDVVEISYFWCVWVHWAENTINLHWHKMSKCMCVVNAVPRVCLPSLWAADAILVVVAFAVVVGFYYTHISIVVSEMPEIVERFFLLRVHETWRKNIFKFLLDAPLFVPFRSNWTRIISHISILTTSSPHRFSLSLFLSLLASWQTQYVVWSFICPFSLMWYSICIYWSLCCSVWCGGPWKIVIYVQPTDSLFGLHQKTHRTNTIQNVYALPVQVQHTHKHACNQIDAQPSYAYMYRDSSNT